MLHDARYTYGTRLETSPGTNPEELVAAAHAGCFSMALSGQLMKDGLTPDRIATAATVTLEKTDAGQTVTMVRLDVRARVPGASAAQLAAAATNAKTTCPISRLLRADITVEARLE